MATRLPHRSGVLHIQACRYRAGAIGTAPLEQRYRPRVDSPGSGARGGGGSDGDEADELWIGDHPRQ
jgi:hypothetical protein